MIISNEEKQNIIKNYQDLSEDKGNLGTMTNIRNYVDFLKNRFFDWSLLEVEDMIDYLSQNSTINTVEEFNELFTNPNFFIEKINRDENKFNEYVELKDSYEQEIKKYMNKELVALEALETDLEDKGFNKELVEKIISNANQCLLIDHMTTIEIIQNPDSYNELEIVDTHELLRALAFQESKPDDTTLELSMTRYLNDIIFVENDRNDFMKETGQNLIAYNEDKDIEVEDISNERELS